MSAGKLSVVGLGPGDARFLTPEAQAALDRAEWLYGYAPYLDRIEVRSEQRKIPSDNRVEAERAYEALAAVVEGRRVAMVSGGDPGVFAMAAAVCEQVERGPEAFRTLELEIVPGISAMLAAAAACGAPLGHDFCVISLSDNLKPWTLIERRLDAAAEVGFAMAFYNPISKARPWQLDSAFSRLRERLPAATPVVFARAVGRVDQRLRVSSLHEASGEWADMATLVIVGSPATRVIERPGRPPLVYTPRRA
ncbi:precorrin-3B C(17)-methyltransferase [Halotalea alkalilenta]|uniref:Precorrin-3B C(17)-methyltransferase n=1 Tax=Halotalea alkalilenta TaxID=376489 RepID=A0A172YCT6_9GAMM|nr:precorrin-3B C(17)-methyltransferase [Halotalea alkalilenta]ANF56912.1 precorrin-3B C(17)-methyltransferase [Halotalea alkalilenta]